MSRGLGSARASRARDGAFAIANFSSLLKFDLFALPGSSFRRGRRNQHAGRVRSPDHAAL